MSAPKTILISVALSIAATAAAAVADQATCPNDWLPQTRRGEVKCCYGNMVIEDKDTFCCVYDMNPVTTSSASAATATTTTDDYGSWSTADECFTKIPFTASNYSDLVSSASSKIVATRTTAVTTEASATNTAISSAATDGSSSATSSGGSQSSSAAASTTSNAGLPRATAQDMVLGGAAVVAGLLVL
ncbi:hypothetical protein N7539_003898 [Penicillium diatomitis]|uniref:Extracellular membrane protein CFEM domain-containing protein n=1 Tax=Penicillium diatomitis TaxID=2819901 RepID=A0A9W9XDS4_9EURO|nr:uncharacterized protein N7539_003898 [Penicillium diatomitis]KAJ5489008.1 hypothetical protein N7539_003898 [Penicillium diatomitis]